MTPERTLARTDVVKVMTSLAEQGFHVQMPPTEEYLANWDNDKLGLRARKDED